MRPGQVWREFNEVQPRVFGLGVISEGAFGSNPVREQDLMQDWSRVNGGYYSYISSQGELEVAYDRAVTMLRRPARYELPQGEYRVVVRTTPRQVFDKVVVPGEKDIQLNL